MLLRLLALAAVLAAPAAAYAQVPGPEIRIEDVARFYRLYDAAGGKPSGEVLERGYIAAGGPGVRDFVPGRILSGERLAQRIGEKPEVYERARGCAAALSGAKARLEPAFRKLGELYPAARFPPVTVLIGRNNSGGTAAASGVLIGLEVVCATVQPDEAVEDRLVHLIAHEYGHVQQGIEPQDPTVLEASIVEGVAELLAELTTGRIANHHLIAWTRGREREIGEAFLRDAASKDRSAWLYNGVGTAEAPGDLGYWVGWRIARNYYDRASDKRRALAELLTMRDPQAILAASGWKPGD